MLMTMMTSHTIARTFIVELKQIYNVIKQNVEIMNSMKACNRLSLERNLGIKEQKKT